MVSAALAGTGKAGMCSSRCQGETMRSQVPLLLFLATCCPSFFALGAQVEQPLQLGGVGLQVGGELGPGLCRAAAKSVKQLAVVVCGAAELTAGALGERQGQTLLLLELSVETAQPGAAGGRNQGGVAEPVTSTPHQPLRRTRLQVGGRCTHSEVGAAAVSCPPVVDEAPLVAVRAVGDVFAL